MMAAEEQQQESQQGGGPGKGTAVKAAAAAAATSVAALAAKKALSHRESDSGNGSSASGGDSGSVLNSVLSGGWEAARDALIPAAEDAAGAAGEYLASNGPEIVRERIIPRFIESFNKAHDGG
jgi:hypothetical protein